MREKLNIQQKNTLEKSEIEIEKLAVAANSLNQKQMHISEELPIYAFSLKLVENGGNMLPKLVKGIKI